MPKPKMSLFSTNYKCNIQADNVDMCWNANQFLIYFLFKPIYMKPKLKTDADIKVYLISHVLEEDISYRWWTLKIDVSELFPYISNYYDETVVWAYQNYLGGGIAGCIVWTATFQIDALHTKDVPLFRKILEETKKLFFEINNWGGDEYMQSLNLTYENNQKWPVSAY
jgi:hypothetical protein